MELLACSVEEGNTKQCAQEKWGTWPEVCVSSGGGEEKRWEAALVKWEMQRDCQIKAGMNSTGSAVEEALENLMERNVFQHTEWKRAALTGMLKSPKQSTLQPQRCWNDSNRHSYLMKHPSLSVLCWICASFVEYLQHITNTVIIKTRYKKMVGWYLTENSTLLVTYLLQSIAFYAAPWQGL